MKMNYIHWIRRIFVYAAIFCLVITSTGFRAQPAPAGAPEWVYKINIVLFRQPEAPVCLHRTYSVDGVYNVITRWPPDEEKLQPVALLPTGKGVLTVKAKGKISLKKFSSPNVQVDKVEPFAFTYEATELGPDTITMEVKVEYAFKGVKKRFTLTEKRELPINVVPCKYKVHGTADIGKVMNAMMPGPGWEYVGIYDVFGEVIVDEKGINGVGTATTSQVFVWTGAPDVPGLTCVQEPPWEGFTNVEFDGDVAALAEKGTLNLRMWTAPMSIGNSQIQCVDAEGGSGGMPFPATTTDFSIESIEPVSAAGGHTTTTDGVFEMDLVIIPVEEK